MHTDDNSVMGEVFFALCKTIDTPISLGAWLRFKYSQNELASMELNPRNYMSAASFSRDYAVVSLLSKYRDLETGNDLEAEALRKFTLAEDQCRETNLRFRNLATVRNGRLHGVLHSAQRKIAKLLGPFSMFCVSDAYGWGPGATLEIPRRRAYVDTKMCELPISVSRSARSALRAEIEGDLQWSSVILGVQPEGKFCLLDSVFSLREECKVATVPKNAKTHRIIAVEPRGNAFLQKGFGAFIRDRLRTVGINLDNQGANQRLARLAYSSGLATLDLKAASDTVSKEVVYSLLPYDWAASLDAVRSRLAVMPDKSKVVLEKFSSMGNGFTFELETLIFWALASSVSEANQGTKGTVAVYGDDIIVDRAVATELCLTLQFCGFSVNDQKSFIDGPFFESCGKHYFMGDDVTPAYQKEVVDGGISAVRLGNRLIRLAFRLGNERHLDRLIRPAWDAVRRLSGFHHLAIPFGQEADDAWLLPCSEFPHNPRRNRSDPLFLAGMGFWCKVVKERTYHSPANDKALLAWSLRSGSKDVNPRSAWNEAPLPFDGVMEIVPRVATLIEVKRRVIPVGQFSVLWQ